MQTDEQGVELWLEDNVMAAFASSTDPIASHDRPDLTPNSALQYAWWSWLVMLLLPFFLFLYVIWTLMDETGAAKNLRVAQVWFIVSMAYLAVAVPLAIFWRSHVFKAYWHGQVVSPRDYLSGMLSVWITIEIGGIFSLVGCLISHGLLPHLLPALVAFMLFVPLWPSGRAMVRRIRRPG